MEMNNYDWLLIELKLAALAHPLAYFDFLIPR